MARPRGSLAIVRSGLEVPWLLVDERLQCTRCAHVQCKEWLQRTILLSVAPPQVENEISHLTKASHLGLRLRPHPHALRLRKDILLPVLHATLNPDFPSIDIHDPRSDHYRSRRLHWPHVLNS